MKNPFRFNVPKKQDAPANAAIKEAGQKIGLAIAEAINADIKQKIHAAISEAIKQKINAIRPITKDELTGLITSALSKKFLTQQTLEKQLADFKTSLENSLINQSIIKKKRLI